MTRQQFDQIFRKFQGHYPVTLTEYEISAYYEKFENLNSASNLDATIDRAMIECRRIPSPDELYGIFRDLTYWDASGFEIDWREAYHKCTGRLYVASEDGKSFDKARVKETDYWCSAGKQLLQNFTVKQGGRKAVQQILKDYAARGYLCGRTMTEFLDGLSFGPVDGWERPRQEPPVIIPPQAIARQANLKVVPDARVDLETWRGRQEYVG